MGRCVLKTDYLELNDPELQEQTGPSKQPIRTHSLAHVTGYQPIRDQYFLTRTVYLFNCPDNFPIKIVQVFTFRFEVTFLKYTMFFSALQTVKGTSIKFAQLIDSLFSTF